VDTTQARRPLPVAAASVAAVAQTGPQSARAL